MTITFHYHNFTHSWTYMQLIIENTPDTNTLGRNTIYLFLVYTCPKKIFSVKKAKDKWWNKQGNTSFLDSSKSMVEMDLESDKGIFCFVLFWFNLCFERMFNNLWWYTCSQIKLYKNVLNLLYLHDVNFIV